MNKMVQELYRACAAMLTPAPDVRPNKMQEGLGVCT